MIQYIIFFAILIILVSIYKINAIEQFENKQKQETNENLYNELKLRILNEDYVKDNLNKLSLNDKLNLINKLSKINYYLPLDIFKDRTYKDSVNLLENKKLAMELSEEINNYYLRGFRKKEKKQFLEIIRKQTVYVPIIYFNNLSYLNSVKFLQKLLDPKFKYPLNLFEENKLNSKFIFDKEKNKDIQRYFKGVTTIQRSIGNNKVNLIPNTKLGNIREPVDILNSAALENENIELQKDKKLSPEQQLNLDLENIEEKIIAKLSNKLPKNKVNYDKIIHNVETKPNYIVDEYYISLLKKQINEKKALLKEDNSSYDV